MCVKYYELSACLMLARAYSVKIRVIFGVRFQRRKMIKKANVHEN